MIAIVIADEISKDASSEILVPTKVESGDSESEDSSSDEEGEKEEESSSGEESSDDDSSDDDDSDSDSSDDESTEEHNTTLETQTQRGLLGDDPQDSVRKLDDLLAPESPEQGGKVSEMLDGAEASALKSPPASSEQRKSDGSDEEDESSKQDDDSSFDAESVLESIARDAQQQVDNDE